MTDTIRSRWAGAAAAGLLILAAALQTGCMAPAYIATQIENSGNDRQFDKGKQVLLKHIQTLQDQGDPLGDYFYALGVSDGWIMDPLGPKAITELFRKAAAKGSMDAKILLALQKATSEPVPGRLDHSKGPRGNLVAWEAGLAELLPLLQQQCYVRRLVVGSGREFSTDLRPYVTTYAVAYDIWPTFRDGHHVQDEQKNWVLIVPKNPERQKVWEDLHKRCATPPIQWLDTLYKK